jgi:hypothetical protein
MNPGTSDLDDLTCAHFAAAPEFHLSIDLDLAFADQVLRTAPALREARRLEERVERDVVTANFKVDALHGGEPGNVSVR